MDSNIRKMILKAVPRSVASRTSIAQIAKNAGLSEVAVRRHMPTLVAQGLVIEHRVSGHPIRREFSLAETAPPSYVSERTHRYFLEVDTSNPYFASLNADAIISVLREQLDVRGVRCVKLGPEEATVGVALAASLLNVSQATVRTWAKRGVLRVFSERPTRFRMDEIEAMLMKLNREA